MILGYLIGLVFCTPKMFSSGMESIYLKIFMSWFVVCCGSLPAGKGVRVIVVHNYTYIII